jgi:hypothetical protein
MGATQTYLFGLIKMNRRYISELPMSRLAIWSRHMAWFALATTVIAIIIVRSDFLEERFGLPTLGGALAFGFIGVFLGPTLLAVGFRLMEEWNSTNHPEPDTVENLKPGAK